MLAHRGDLVGCKVVGENGIIVGTNKVVWNRTIRERAVWPIRAGWDYPDIPGSAGLLFASYSANQAAQDEVTPIQQGDRCADEALVAANLAIDRWMPAPVSMVS